MLSGQLPAQTYGNIKLQGDCVFFQPSNNIPQIWSAKAMARRLKFNNLNIAEIFIFSRILVNIALPWKHCFPCHVCHILSNVNFTMECDIWWWACLYYPVIAWTESTLCQTEMLWIIPHQTQYNLFASRILEQGKKTEQQFFKVIYANNLL